MEEAEIRRIPPHSTEAEQSVIGSMFLDREAIVAATGILSADDFFGRQYAILYEAIVDLFEEHKPVDSVTIKEKLLQKQAPPEVMNEEFIAAVIGSVPTSANARYYANIVHENAVKRRLIRVNEDIAAQCYKGELEIDDLLNETEAKIFNIVQSRGSAEIEAIDRVVLRVLDRIQQASLSSDKVMGVPTGFQELDYMTSGLHPGNLVLIAARPSMGKTAFALNIASNAVLRFGKRVLIFSLEMTKDELVNRLIAMDSYVDSSKLRSGELDDSDWDDIVVSAGRLGRSSFVIDDSSTTISQIRSICRRQKLEYGLDMVIIDYLQLMSGGVSKYSNSNRQQEVSDISRALKVLARELECPIVALSQLSRAPEQRQDHMPMLSDLRESGAIEQDADVVMFIYRDEVYNEDTKKKGIASINVAKQRNGAVGIVDLAWIAAQTKFMNLDRSRMEEASEEQ
ncbi:MAG: replicative DNA helicase [Lachnospiraceae bacterium]|nr:replicative DNA helicase [Lachnospiraceae bacterium]